MSFHDFSLGEAQQQSIWLFNELLEFVAKFCQCCAIQHPMISTPADVQQSCLLNFSICCKPGQVSDLA